MKWYKQFPDQHPAIKPALDAFGWEGKGIMDKLTQLVQESGAFELEVSVLQRNFGFNARKANRIFPIISQCFIEVCKSLDKDSDVSGSFAKFQEVSQSLPKLESQNPHGSTRDLEKNREDKKESPLPPEGASEGFQKFWTAYPKGVRKTDKTGCFRKWKARKLESIADSIVESLEVHKRTKDWLKDGGQYIPAPMVFLNRSSWEAEIETVLPQAEQKPHKFESLRRFEFVRESFGGATIPTKELRIVDSTTLAYYPTINGDRSPHEEFVCIAHLEGIEETLVHV